MLQYLEDLQKNNPAEYELIAKQIQEQGAAGLGGKGGKKPARPAGGPMTKVPIAASTQLPQSTRPTLTRRVWNVMDGGGPPKMPKTMWPHAVGR